MARRLTRSGLGILSVRPATNDHLAAVRVGVSVAVPLAALLIAGRPDLSIYAVFGAFTGMYGRDERHQLRLYHQLTAAALLIAGVTTGAVLSAAQAGSWVLILVESLAAGVGSLAADRANLKPVGPFFGIFALGACASVPPIAPVPVVVAVAATSAGFSVAVGVAGGVLRRTAWEAGVRRVAPSLTGARLRVAMIHATAYVLAVGSAGAAGQLTGDGHAYWAMAAAAVPLAGADFAGRIRRGLHRILGTFVGLGVTALILSQQRGAVLLVVLIAALQFPTELFMTRHYGLALVFFTPLILIMTELAHPTEPGILIAERGLETLIGAVVGMAVAVLVLGRSSRTAGRHNRSAYREGR
ncbi:MAG: FUSC family protein [Arthrobacter sp.]